MGCIAQSHHTAHCYPVALDLLICQSQWHHLAPMPTPTDKTAPARWQIVSPSRLRPTLFARRKYGAQRFGVAPVLPMSCAEMEQLGWECCDVILVTGDAYVDHPSFGAALIGRVL